MRNFKINSIVFFILLILLSSCAPGNEKFIENDAGFLYGLWHGFISVISLIISFFNSDVHMYEINNTGWWYDLGFLIGAGFAFSNIWFTGSKAKKR